MIDWSQAPEGATHRQDSRWYKHDATGLWYWERRSWWKSAYPDIQLLISTCKVHSRYDSVKQPKAPQTAAGYCDAAKGHMVDRATTYDAPAGERSMAKTVAAFNSLTGHQLTEEQGWLFMETLKMARSQQGQFKQDNYEDAVAYAALRGEAAEKERPCLTIISGVSMRNEDIINRQRDRLRKYNDAGFWRRIWMALTKETV